MRQNVGGWMGGREHEWEGEDGGWEGGKMSG